MKKISFLAVCAVLSLFSGSCAKKGEKQAGQAPPEVKVVPVEKREIPVYAESVGEFDSPHTVEMRARVDGYLDGISFTEGSLVRKGELLFVIDPRPYLATRKMAEAQLAQAEASLYSAKKDITRYRALIKTRAVSQQQLDQAIAALLKAQADQKAAAASLQKADLDLAYTRIESPVTGRIGRANFKRGALVRQGDSILATISSTDPVYVNFSISEREYLSLGKLLAKKETVPPELELTLANNEKYDRAGKLDMRERAIDPKTGTLGLRGVFANPEGLLLPGGFARVRMLVAEKTPALLVPQRAVAELQGAHSVMVVTQDGKVQERPVTTGPRIGSSWVISRGLNAGENVVTEGLQKVHPGQSVRVEPTQAAGQAGSK